MQTQQKTDNSTMLTQQTIDNSTMLTQQKTDNSTMQTQQTTDNSTLDVLFLIWLEHSLNAWKHILHFHATDMFYWSYNVQ